jgi:two-component system nitrate/nitrite response regulator NarL
MEKLLSTEIAGHEDLRIADLVWVKGTSSVATLGLARALEAEFRIHRGAALPPTASERPSAVIICFLDGGADDDDVASAVHSAKAAAPDAAVLVLAPSLELPLIGAAVSAGARGFLHTGVPPGQLVRALSVVLRGEMALPREILKASVKWLNEGRGGADLSTLSERQSEILELVVEGLSNAQIAKRLSISESTVKQHLGAAYKLLGVKNRREASAMVRQAQQPGREVQEKSSRNA